MRPPLSHLGVLFVTALTSADWMSAGPPGQKEPWRWTDEERLAARFAPGSAAIRFGQASARATLAGSGAVMDYVEGSTHPALFLRWELFDQLLRRCFASNAGFRTAERAGVASRVDSLRITDETWLAIENASGDYLARLRKQWAFLEQLDDPHANRARIVSQIEQLQAGQCARRLSALDAVTTRLGSDPLDRLLYQGIAPGSFTLSSTTDPDPSTAETLLRVARGCK